MPTRHARSPTHTRLVGSLALLAALVGGCVHYLVRETTQKPGSVLAYLDNLPVPVWPILLGLGALGVLLGACLRRVAVGGHSIAVGVLAAYDAALWWGVAVGSNGWVTASFALALAVHAAILTNAYARRPVWMPR